MYNRDEIGKRIKAARLEKHLSQIKFAELINVSTPYLSDIENGKTNLSLEIFVRIVEALQVSADCIENMEGSSGVLLYLSSVLSPTVIIVFTLFLILFYLRFAFADEERSCLIIVQALSIAEALMLALINVIIPTTSVIGCLWTITSCFIVFSLILPDLNPKIAPIILDHLPNAMVSVLNKEWI